MFHRAHEIVHCSGFVFQVANPKLRAEFLLCFCCVSFYMHPSWLSGQMKVSVKVETVLLVVCVFCALTSALQLELASVVSCLHCWMGIDREGITLLMPRSNSAISQQLTDYCTLVLWTGCCWQPSNIFQGYKSDDDINPRTTQYQHTTVARNKLHSLVSYPVHRKR